MAYLSKMLKYLTPISSRVKPIEEISSSSSNLEQILKEQGRDIREFVESATTKGSIYVETKDKQPVIPRDNDRPVQITINGPWYIREEMDINKVVNKIRRAMQKQFISRKGGPII